MKTKPVNEIRISNIKAAVWQNKVGEVTRHNVTFSRIYKEGDSWKTSDSFGRDDLPRLILAAQKAYVSLIQTQPEEASA